MTSTVQVVSSPRGEGYSEHAAPSSLSGSHLRAAHKISGQGLGAVGKLRSETGGDQGPRPVLASNTEHLVPPSGLWHSSCPNEEGKAMKKCGVRMRMPALSLFLILLR